MSVAEAIRQPREAPLQREERRHLPPPPQDIAIAAVAIVALLTAAATSPDKNGPFWLNATVIVAMAAPLAWRRRAPLLAASAYLAGSVVHAAVPLSGFGEQNIPTWFFFYLVVAYGVGRHTPANRRAIGLALLVCGTLAMFLIMGIEVITDLIFPPGFTALAWLIGRGLAQREQLALLLEERAARAETDREAEARRAVLEERARIARELHDVVAHSVSMMVVQAGGARRMVEKDAARAEQAAELIADAARNATAEMERLFGALTEEEAAGATLERVPQLVEHARAGGLEVELHVDGERGHVAQGVDLVAYRIVQEALTNAVKHAAPTRARVNIDYGPGEIALVIVDEGREGGGRTELQQTGAGHGLVGMRERVAVYGGRVEAGPRDRRGFRVSATLPRR